MMRFLLIISFFQLAFSTAYAQKNEIYSSDNTGNKYILFNYRLNADSLYVTGISDYGKTNVSYLKRKLTPEESKKVEVFIAAFHLENFKKEYSAYSHPVIADEHHRIIEFEIQRDLVRHKTKIIDTYVKQIGRFYKLLNKMLPDEVKIKYSRFHCKGVSNK